MTKRKWICCKLSIICFILLIIIFGLSMYSLKEHVAGHMASISTSTPISDTRPTKIVWYHADCHHCREVIPTDYVINKLTFQKVQYRNIDTQYNARMQLKMHSLSYPSENEVKPTGQNYQALPQKMASQRWGLISAMIIGYVMLIVLLDWLICFLCI